MSSGSAQTTVVQRYWTGHTVNSNQFRDAEDSLAYLEQRAAQYPLFQELMDIPGDHAGETVLDYGCGPGDDLVNFAVKSGAGHVIGMDVSPTALDLARQRLALHPEADGRVELIRTEETSPEVPLADGAVDYLHSGGVIHHASDPQGVLNELGRVVKPGGRGRIMVYNRASVWFHLFVAWRLQIKKGRYTELSAEQAFGKTTDGEDCPIALCFEPADWIRMCGEAGLEAEFLGAYPHKFELRWLRRWKRRALRDGRLGEEHRAFLERVDADADGVPTLDGKPAGIGACYAVRRAG